MSSLQLKIGRVSRGFVGDCPDAVQGNCGDVGCSSQSLAAFFSQNPLNAWFKCCFASLMAANDYS